MVKFKMQRYNLPDRRDEKGSWLQSYRNSDRIRLRTRAGGLWSEIKKRANTTGNTPYEMRPSYEGCSNDFIDFQSFTDWCHSQPNYLSKEANGMYYAIDKDIIVPFNRNYGPDTCCFVPARLNTLLIYRSAMRGSYPLGVYLDKKSGKTFKSQVSTGSGPQRSLGYFKTPHEAHLAWQKAKVEVIESVIEEYSHLPDSVLHGLHLHAELIKDDVLNGRLTQR